VISYAWRTGFAPDEERELREMLAAAAAEDAEAGFPAVSLDQPYRDGASHLVVRLLPDNRAGQGGSSPAGAAPVAAYLRIEPGADGGRATARYVVRPEFRSRGISTLLVEMLGQDPAAGAIRDAEPLRIWARGDHPAAQRMARRFAHLGVRPARRQWQLLAPLRPGDPPPPPGPAPRPPAGAAERAAATALLDGEPVPRQAEVLVDGTGAPEVAGAVWYDPHAGEPTEYGTAGRILAIRAARAADPEIQARLLAAAMAGLRDCGLRVAAIIVDADDPVLARACRLRGFRHDRTDIEYIVAGLADMEVSR
jgi:mycothiol synthase